MAGADVTTEGAERRRRGAKVKAAEVKMGDVVAVRSRQYLVEDVTPPPQPNDATRVRLSCVEDDALGETLEVLWEHERDAQRLSGASWDRIARRGFDDPRKFSAYLHTLRWGCVTATDPTLFQAPYRAGIEVKAYQLEPLRKALLMPRVNLFIADDVGLGKTIEAGLILREMIIRQRVRRVVICCPPSVVRQWKDEMEQRFGLAFVIYDRDFVAQKRRERGYGVNPFTTHSRFIISHALVRDEDYTANLRDWLGEISGGAMLILDEAHNVAPASGSKYAVDSQLTRTVRDLAPRFEHRLFLSATPHNGHSNSFSALLEILDPLRFCRGVPVKRATLLENVMVRRLKRDLRGLDDDFPERKVVRIEIDGLHESAPELVLSRLLQRYRLAREQRLQGQPAGRRTSAMLVITSLQKRLLSSIEAFHRTLTVHRRSLPDGGAAPPASGASNALGQTPGGDSPRVEGSGNDARATRLALLDLDPPDADDDRAELPEDEVAAEDDARVAALSRQSATAPSEEERRLLDEMARVASAARYQADSRIERLRGWIKENLCPDLGKPGAQWLPRRVLIFTDYADTKHYLMQQLQAMVASSDEAGARVEAFHGGISEERREAIKAAFNADPARHPLRILVATDAAREGVNLQNHCADLFHFDVPWNPSKMEQRNGRIDRKLQREAEVRCHYFVVQQRAEDRVLDVLVDKTATIRRELGSLPTVVEKRMARLLRDGITDQNAEQLVLDLGAVEHDPAESDEKVQVVAEELEEVREVDHKLAQQIERLQEMLKRARDHIGLDEGHFRDALSASLELLGAPRLRPLDDGRWEIPDLRQRLGSDPTWAATLDSLRAPPKKGQKLWEWRKEAPVRPVVFRDPRSLDGEVVHLHLEQRLVRRLLHRFMAQGFVHDELSRACVLACDDPVPRVLLFGRLSMYGDHAARLHDEVLLVAARWTAPETRRGTLQPLEGDGERECARLLETSLSSARAGDVRESDRKRLQACGPRDVAELVSALEARGRQAAKEAEAALKARGDTEAKALYNFIEGQRERIEKRRAEVDASLGMGGGLKPEQTLLAFYTRDEQRQLEADRRHWDKRLADIDAERETEPKRVRQAYKVRATRIEPVGLVYLWHS